MDTDLRPSNLVDAIRAEAVRLGFSACGFATASALPQHIHDRWKQWIAHKQHASMEYMERYESIRCNVQELLPGTQSVISLALNYYPSQLQPAHHPRFAYYAYGRDYHEVMREKLQQLATYICSLVSCQYRICCDTAPIFERYWAQQAGIGFMGRNSQLILPEQGSYFFLGEILITHPLPASQPCTLSCHACRRCIDACPVKAIGEDGTIDARRCISCQTIENRGEIPVEVATRLGRRIYGCDTCQQVCPHNNHASATAVAEFAPSPEFLSLDYKTVGQLTPDSFRRIFKQSAVKRAKYEGLMRNFVALDSSLFEER